MPAAGTHSIYMKTFLCALNPALPIDLIRLERLSTLWFEGNPIEFPPPPIPETGSSLVLSVVESRTMHSSIHHVLSMLGETGRGRLFVSYIHDLMIRERRRKREGGLDI